MLITKISVITDSVIKEIIDILQSQLEKSRSGQMPMNTFGVLSKSLKGGTSEGIISSIEIQSEDYGLYLDKGIPDVPYSPGSGEKKPSAYIGDETKGLMRWVTKKFGVTGLRAKKIAFMIAKSQKRGIGVGTVSTSAPSNPGWVHDIKDELDKKVKQKLHDYTFVAIQEDVFRILNRTI